MLCERKSGFTIEWASLDDNGALAKRGMFEIGFGRDVDPGDVLGKPV